MQKYTNMQRLASPLNVARGMTDHLPQDFRLRSFKFSCRLFDFCEELARLPGLRRRLAYQLWDAGSSIGANLEEAKAASSRRELAAKDTDALQEAREAKYWLRIATAKCLGRKELRSWLFQEADEFVAMLTVAVKRLQTEADPRSDKDRAQPDQPRRPRGGAGYRAKPGEIPGS